VALAAQPAAVPDIAAVASRVRPATVMVQNLTTVPPDLAQRIGAGEVPRGVGSGFIYDPAGFIITNNHVVEGADSLRVVLPPPDNRQFDAQLIGADPQTDLAVIKVDANDLPSVSLGKSSDLKVGQWVVAVGNALGLPGGPTVTAGVVSALSRDIPEPGSSPNTSGPLLYDLIQTDAAINPGNSGGPLVNLNDEVVGINTLGTSSANAIGFAISMDTARPITEQLRQNGKVTRGYLGIAATSVNQAIQTARGLQSPDGVLVGQVQPGGPAATAGMQADDVIVKIGDTEVSGQGDLERALTLSYKPGETVPVTVIRSGSQQTLQVTLGTRPPR
jgi:S1-C subfamily serine protease